MYVDRRVLFPLYINPAGNIGLPGIDAKKSLCLGHLDHSHSRLDSEPGLADTTDLSVQTQVTSTVDLDRRHKS